MNNKLQGKDLINIGIFTALYFIVIFAAASIGFIPIFIPLISVIVPIVGGIPMMLFFRRSRNSVCSPFVACCSGSSCS